MTKEVCSVTKNCDSSISRGLLGNLAIRYHPCSPSILRARMFLRVPWVKEGPRGYFFPVSLLPFSPARWETIREKVENIGGDRSSTTSSSTTSKSERLQCDREKKRRHTPLRIRSECRCFSVFQRDDYSYTIDHALDEKPHSTAMRLRVFFRRPWDAIRRGTKPEGTSEETQWISELDRLEKKWYFNSNASG